MKAGTRVRIKGLVSASHHNGKTGTITGTSAPAEGRVGVKLDDDARVLAIKIGNLEILASQSNSTGKGQRAPPEFDGSPDPNVLALYYHYADRAFDCFNAAEYNTQMLRYYDHGLSVRLVIPRRIGSSESNLYFLVGLQHADTDKNTLCEVAFNCGRSFAGISMLVKRRCFACNRPRSAVCKSCLCACFCSEACENSDVGKDHRKLCGLIDTSSIVTEDECVQLL
eukprot:CAMPEP_0178695614 /NCGR_PEP_ID=MMETSP0699-20121125/8954_1 /TAXON_ID=265572 /ORGANISM="Extubocellulus spinifer, Strain CCMP396" /LENGTH=224 /DNA_ID=CAMNT_0020341333 /DNA_START=10 /DNA_END=685 /DNA_ORIENTATION=-